MSDRILVNRKHRPAYGSLMILGALSCAVLLAIAYPASAGGFQISVETPARSNDPQLRDVVLIARTFGCLRPADAKLSASAEGFVDGKRKSLPVELRSIGSGVYGVDRQWPSEGRWVLALTGRYNGMISSVLVELGPDGNVLPGTRLKEGYLKGVNAKGVQRAWVAGDIDAALQLPAGTTSRTTSEQDASGALNLGPITWVFAALGASAFTIGFFRRTRRRHSLRESASQHLDAYR